MAAATTEPITRFRTQKAGALLAYLALHGARSHGREELADRFWPDADPEAGRTSLRAALASLRRQLEPPGVAAGAVLVSVGHADVRLNPVAVSSDVADFERLLQATARPATPPHEQRARLLAEAVALYRGPLLPGFYETWVLSERDRLAEAHGRALIELVQFHEQAGDSSAALDFARRAVSADPLREEAHAAVIRLLVSRGDVAAARRQYEELARLLDEQLGDAPSPEVRALLRPAAPRPASPPLPPPSVSTVPVYNVASSTPSHFATATAGSVVTAAAPSLSTAAAPHLPTAFTPFFGREGEMAALVDWLTVPDGADGATTRLVTLSGPGGNGKTRLAVETARRVAEHFRGGVWFVGLADVRESARIPDALADALCLPRSPNVTPLEQVIGVLSAATDPALLVLDNFEQLVDDGGINVVQTLLVRAPRLTCLVTSRRQLLLEGEREFALPPLPTPAHPGTPERLLEFASVRLFVSRAQIARPDFQLTPRNANVVAHLCARLEGVPLALELAAAWSQTLTPAQMLERLERRFDLLVSRRRDLPDRHRTLRAAIEWSWNLLSPDLQAFFAQLSAFRGGWTLDAAEAVTGEARTLEYLAELRERSFIVTEAAAPPDEPCAPTGTSSESTNSAAAADDGALRFRMLETLREFAGEQVGDDAARSAVADWHARYFAALAEEAEPKLHGPEQVAWLCRLTREYDNLRAALAWSLDDREQRAEDGNDEQIADLGLRLAGALARYWLVRGHADEGRDWLGKALAPGDGSPVLRARALRGAWALAWRRRDRDEAVRLAEAGLALGRVAGNDADAAFFLGTLGLAAYLSDEPQRARALLEQAVALARQVGDDWLTGQCLCWLGTVLIAQGQDGPAGQVLNEGLAALDAQGDIYGSAIVLRMLGLSLLGRGNLDGARQRTEQSIARFRELDDPAMIGSSTLMLGFIAYDEKDFVAARAHFDTALDRCRAVGDRFGMAHAWHNRAHVFLAEHEYAATRQDLAQSLAVFHDLHFGGDVALSLEAFARLACAEEHWERALELTGATDTLRKAIGLPLPNIHRAKRDEDATRARQALGDVRADAALARGRRLTTEQAVRAALEPTGD